MTAIPHWRVAGSDDAAQSDAVPDWSSVWWDGEGLHISANHELDRSLYRLQFDRGATFDVHPADRLIIASANRNDIAPLTIDHLLSDQVEPRILAHEGELIIHASAIRLNGASILFVGTSGVGKSTLAASFDEPGTGLLCDDAVIVECADEQATARALYPSLRLHPDSLDALFPDRDPSLSTAHFGEKRRLTIAEPPNDHGDPLPIAAIFALGATPAAEGIQIKPLSPAEVCMALVANSFSLNPADLGLAGEKLSKAGLIAERVPAFALDYPRDYGVLPAVRAAVLESVRTLSESDR